MRGVDLEVGPIKPPDQNGDSNKIDFVFENQLVNQRPSENKNLIVPWSESKRILDRRTQDHDNLEAVTP